MMKMHRLDASRPLLRVSGQNDERSEDNRS
jgi:hypothetical protein